MIDRKVWLVLDAFRAGKVVKYKEWLGYGENGECWGTKRMVTALEFLLPLFRYSGTRFFIDDVEVE